MTRRNFLHDPGLYREIVESIRHMVWIAAADGTIEYVNARCVEYTGFSSAELRAGEWRRVYHPDELDTCVARWKGALSSGEPFEADYRLRRADGAFRWHRHVVQNRRDERGSVIMWFGTCTDVEEQLRAVHESELRFHSFMTNLAAGAWIKDSQMRLTWINPQDVRNRGKQLHEVVGRTDFELRSPRIARRLREQDEEVQRLQRPMQYVNSLPRAGGTQSHFLVVKFPLPDAGGGTGVAGIAIDITESRHLERTVRELLGRLVEAQENERHKLAADLHDLIGQKLSALGIGLQIVRVGLSPDTQKLHAPRLAQMSALIEETVGEVRSLMNELRPSALEDHGLTAALFQHAAVFEARTGLRVQVSGPEHADALPGEVALALFRIAHEALTNAAKHSGATLVQLQLEAAAQRATLVVDDDGHGIRDTVAQRRAGTWGLRIIRERAEAVGGRLRIESSSAGTRILVDIRYGHGDRRHPG